MGTGATLSVGTGTSVLLDPVTITDNGTMSVTGASVGFVAGFEATTQILVNGTLSASGSSFYTSGGSYESFTLLQVDSGGELMATSSTFSINELSLVNGSIMNTGDLTNDIFNLPIYVPFQDVRPAGQQPELPGRQHHRREPWPAGRPCRWSRLARCRRPTWSTSSRAISRSARGRR